MGNASVLPYYFRKVSPDQLSGLELDELLSQGWFRSQQSMLTTTHLVDEEQQTLQDVCWLRYSISEIRSHASHRRILAVNKNFQISHRPFKRATLQENTLYARYWSSISFDTYCTISKHLYHRLTPSIFATHAIRVFDGERLIALALYDVGNQSACSIMHCYDPAYRKYSLGKYLMLLTIKHLKDKGFTYYYPGYVVAGNPRLDYKLFLGKESACYYDRSQGQWKLFDDQLLQPKIYKDEEVLRFILHRNFDWAV